jgi:holo-[acyl-carrier protein] synthase
MRERSRASTAGTAEVLSIDPPGGGIHSGGLDLVDIDRLGRAVDRCGPPFLRRLFDADEREACGGGADPVATAALFGIKESVVKILGGLPPGTGYRDFSIDVGSREAYLPVRFRGELARWTEAHGVGVIAGSAPRGHGVVLSWALALSGETPC